MSRSFTLDSRTLAYADVPILPILAPRAFRESPLRNFTQTYHSGYDATHIHTNTRNSDILRKRDASKKTKWSGGNHRCDVVQPAYATRTPACRSTNRPSQIPFRGILHRNIHSSTCAASSNLRYLDIFSFGQTQLARYSTESQSSDFEVEEVAPSVGRARPWRRRKSSPRLASPLLNRRRVKALGRDHERYKTFLSSKSTTDVAKLMLDGRYRSLRRRLFALGFPGPVKLQMPWRDDTGGFSKISRGLAALDSRVYRRRKRCSNLIKIQHHPRVEEYAHKLCEGVTPFSTDRMWSNWVEFDKEARSASWDFILFYLLDQNQQHALQFIQVLAQEPPATTLNPALLADALEHIARLLVRNMQPKLIAPDISDLIPTFTYVFGKYLAEHQAICSQDLLWNIGRLATPDDLRFVFDLLTKKRAWIGYDTLLHYANKFGDAGDHEYALRCLQRILVTAMSEAAARAMVVRPRFQWTCASILRKSTRNGQNYHLTTDIVAKFLKLGVKMDILLYNVVISNAMEADDHTTAFKVFNILEENGAKPNKYTYSILLHGCTTASDPAVFRDFAEHCVEKARELNDPWLATQYLYYLYVRHDNEDTHQLSAVLNHAYSHLFNPGPLEYFSQKEPLAYDNPDELNTTRLEPPPVAVYIMLQVEIRKALSMSNVQVWNLYQFFKRMVNEEFHATINKLAKHPVVWNAFLLAFCRNQQFANASNLIKDMTDGDPSKVPRPNVYSWNIFMQAFFRTDQIRAAERIYEMMRSRDVEPDQYTYRVLLRGYIRAQHTEKIGNILGLIDDDQQMSPDILQYLTKVTNFQRLMYDLEKSKQARDEANRMKLEEEEERRRKRWEPPKLKSMLSRPRLSLSDAQDLSGVQGPRSAVLQESASHHPAPRLSPLDSSGRSAEGSVSQSASSSLETTAQSDAPPPSESASPRDNLN